MPNYNEELQEINNDLTTILNSAAATISNQAELIELIKNILLTKLGAV